MQRNMIVEHGLPSWSELADRAQRDGFTVRVPSGEVPTTGYMVAFDGHEERVPAVLLCAESVAGYVARHWDALTQENAYLGAWLEAGVVYLDVSEWVPTRDMAVRLGLERNQLAVWDVAAGASIGLW